MPYLIIAQVVMFIINIAILINYKLNLDYYHFYYATLPVIVYAVSMIAFYIKNVINYFSDNTRHRHQLPILPMFIVSPAFVFNIAYLCVEVFVENPENPYWFYIATAVVQFVNAISVFAYQKIIIEDYMTKSKGSLNSLVSYSYLFLSLLGIYACIFMDIFSAIIIFLLTALVMTFSISISSIAVRRYKKNRRRSSRQNSHYDDE